MERQRTEALADLRALVAWVDVMQAWRDAERDERPAVLERFAGEDAQRAGRAVTAAFRADVRDVAGEAVGGDVTPWDGLMLHATTMKIGEHFGRGPAWVVSGAMEHATRRALGARQGHPRGLSFDGVCANMLDTGT